MNRTIAAAPTFPAASIARTPSVCSPRFSRLSVSGEEHGSYSGLSNAHSNVAPGSSEENSTVAFGLRSYRPGALSIMVAGATRSGQAPSWISGSDGHESCDSSP